METTNTVSSILWKKILESLEKSTLSGIASNTGKIFFASALSCALVDAHGAIQAIESAMIYSDFAIPKTAGAFAIVFGWKYGANIFKYILESISSITDREENEGEKLVKGIPVSELSDFIFEMRGLPATESMTKLGISRKTYDFLARGLESVGALKRGTNNARVLEESFTRGDIVSILSNVDKSGFKSRSKIYLENIPSPESVGFVISEIPNIAM